MRETEFQENVTDILLNRETEALNIAITDNERAILLQVDGGDAAYTADEARRLAAEIERESEDWDIAPDGVIEYIRDMADVLDENVEASEIEAKWDEKGRQDKI